MDGFLFCYFWGINHILRFFDFHCRFATYELKLQHFWSFDNLNDENRSVNTGNIALNMKKRKGRKMHLKFERGSTVPLLRYSFGTILAVLVRILLFCFQNFKEKMLENNASQKSEN